MIYFPVSKTPMETPATPPEKNGRNGQLSAALRLGVSLTSLVLLSNLHAEPRTSANYTIAADTVDAGGGSAASASYTDSASTGTIAGISTIAGSSQILKAGYIARLSDATGLLLLPASAGIAASAGLPEGGTLQLSPFQALDDGTFLTLSASSVSWSVVSGPLISLSAGGLATAALVYQDTPAVISGTFGGFTSALSLNIRNVNPDDFGSYAGDGLPDGWQVQYFGLNNPNAAPAVDASGTGQTNLFKYTAGLNPLDPTSIFTLEIEPVAGQPAQKDLIFSPVFLDRTYRVEYTADVAAGAWLPLPGALATTAGQVRTVTDPAAASPAKFYRVFITKP